MGSLAAVLVGIPLIWLLVSGLASLQDTETARWQNLPQYFVNSLWLAGGTALGTALLGTGTAWLVTMCSFPGRRIFEWALVLPLAAPAYIIAYAYADFLQHAGPVQTMLRDFMGWGPRSYWFPNIRSLPGAILVFSFVLYPYVYLIVRSALIEQSVCVLEAARSLGRTPWQSFWSVAMPLARPAIVAGVSLATMETLADFGTVSHFGVPTFTTAIYQAYAFLGDQARAASLSTVLLGIVLLLFVVERIERGRATTHATTGYVRALPRFTLSKAQAFWSFVACSLPIILGALLPAGILLNLALAHGHNLLSARYIALFSNTLILGIVAAIVTVGIALLVVYAARTARSFTVRAALSLSALGYAIPGSVIAIAILLPLAKLDNALFTVAEGMGHRIGLVFTGSIFALIYAYVVRFLAIAYRTSEQGLARITPHMEEAGRSLGANEGRILTRIHMPMMRASVLTAGLIVFVEVVKELPATLILRPFNFDTLAVQAYRLASDERLAEASSAALAIIAVGLVSVIFLTRTITRSRISEVKRGTR